MTQGLTRHRTQAALLEGLGTWALGALEVLLATALAVWLLTCPTFFRLYYPALRVSPHARDATTVVHWLSSSYRTRSLNLALQEAKMGPQELQHYSDVRSVFRWLPRVAGGLALLIALLVLGFRSLRGRLLSAHYCGLILWLICLLSVGGLAWWNWAAFFAWVHHPLFGDRSWRLPRGSYSLVLFPASFWRMMAATVLLAPALLLGLAALQLRFWQKTNRQPPPVPSPPN